MNDSSFSRESADPLGELTSVVSLDRQEVVEAFLTDGDLATLEHLARKGTPENSLRALTSDLAALEAWFEAATGGRCRHRKPSSSSSWPTISMTPSSANAAQPMACRLRSRLSGRAGGFCSVPALRPSTVRRRLSSWGTAHRLCGLQQLFATPTVREAFKRAAKACERAPERKSKRAVVRDVLAGARQIRR